LDGPWPGRLPAPHPAVTFPRWLPAQLTDAEGRSVQISGRIALSAPPVRVAVEGHGAAAVAGWGGPWPVLEQWWDGEHARRIARMQVATASGHAWLLVIEHSRWWAEAHYG
jgi:protein ImuB